MCDLLGISFNVPVDPKISFRNFRYKDRCNQDGWGIAWYENDKAKIKKEPSRASTSDAAEQILSDTIVKSKIIISHVRASSCGVKSINNTHPFKRSYIGRDWVFAHNGTLRNLPECNGEFQPEGETDSELAFCLILNWAAQDNLDLSEDANISWLEAASQELNNYGTMNFLMSDGKQLFVYCDSTEHNQLKYISRRAPFDGVKIKLIDVEKVTNKGEFIDLGTQKSAEQEGVIVATTAWTGLPTNEEWKKLESGKLRVW